jgi:hypothetical protein
VNDQLNCTVTVKNNTGQVINMAIVDLGIPPGFDVDTMAFETLQQNGQIEKHEVTGNQVILYLRQLSNETPFHFTCAFRAKYPLRVQTPTSAACALPMLWAARNKLDVSGFITYTDSETWAGNIHPAQALRQYRSEFVGDAKAVVVGMTSNGFTLADPNDRGMMDVVGFDTSAPAVIADFVRE